MGKWTDENAAELQTTAKQPALSSEPVREHLARVLNSDSFAKSDRARRFLEFIVTESLEGRETQLKAYSIALEVFDRGEDFDPQASPIVRVEAGKLRKLLELYYLTEGKDDQVRISIPKGAYVPKFTYQDEAAGENRQPVTDPKSVSSNTRSVSRNGRLAFLSREKAVPIGIFGLLTGVLLVWLAYDTLQVKPNSVSSRFSIPSESRPVVFIAAFDDATNDDSLAGIAGSMSREVLHNLAQFGSIIVVDGALAQGRQVETDEMATARKFNANFILNGQVTQRSRNLRVNVRLTNIEGQVVWSEVLEDDLTASDLFEMQDSISSKVAQTMAQPYGVVYQEASKLVQRTPPDSLSAYQCVISAYEYRLKLARATHSEVRDCLEKAVEAEPQYVEAAAMLSLVYTDEFRFAYNLRDELPQRLSLAVGLARESVNRAPKNPVAWRALFYALFAAGDTEEAIDAGEMAVSLNPNDADVKAVVGFRKAVSGDWEEGLAIMNEAAASAPLHPSGYYFAEVLDYYRSGRYEDALRTMKRIDMPEFFWTHAHYAMIYAQMGQTEKAQAALARTLELMPDFAKRPEDIIRMEIRDENVIKKMLAGLQKAGLNT